MRSWHWRCPGLDTVHKVSIIPHGVGALGYTIQRPTEDRYLMTRAELEHKMAALLGGRASEQLVFDEISTGAADDLARATDIARAMVLRYGMSEALGNVTYDRDRSPFLQPAYPMPQERGYGESTAEAVDHAVRALVDRAFARRHRCLAAKPCLARPHRVRAACHRNPERARNRALKRQIEPAADLLPAGSQRPTAIVAAS